MTDVLLLWHMHQPRYVHPMTGRPILPWVRLHASSGYLDMARALERRPGVHATVNFVPSLVEQLEDMLAGARDVLEEIAEKPAADLDETERQTVLLRCFSARHDRAIRPRPRYAELHAKRGEASTPDAVAARFRDFSTADLRDAQCLFLLSWLGFAAREDHVEMRELERKGREFTEDDKRTILAVVRRAAGAVLPSWRRLCERGQVELCTSPYYHPILPLLIDSDCARRSRPGDRLPPRFAHPEDASAQLQQALATHARVFGAPPAGMWPSEGSISPEAVALCGQLGVKWLAADEETLQRSLDGAAASSPPAAPPRTRFWRHAGVDLVFRDRDLSDRIGFRYADVPAAAAAAELVTAARASGAGGVCGLFLDGENAWESYPRRGADFLDALYARIEEEAAAGKLRSRTISESLAERGPGLPLPRLHSGSWIEASFRIWIGDPVKNQAWTQLGRVRSRVAQAELGSPGDKRVALARRLCHAAEGSDWFWWFGEPFSSAEDPIFDELFRAHLEAAWRALGEEPPADLARPLARAGLPPSRAAVPPALIHPMLDGKAGRFYEWQGAAAFEIGRGGAMADSGHPIERVFVGFDSETLYLRVDPAKRDRRLVAACHLSLQLAVGDRVETLRILTGAADGGAELRARDGRIAALNVLELSLPLSSIGARPRTELRLDMRFELAGVIFARVPRDGAIAVVVPWPGFDEENWSA